MPDHGAEIEAAVSRFSEWELGGGRFQGAGQNIDILESWREKSGLSFNLKNKNRKRYLHWEEQTFGINLGFSDDATEQSAREDARWFFKRGGSDRGPVRYGEPVAMGFGTFPSFYKYAHRTIGVNLENTGTPSYEWRLIGPPGTSGKPVKTGQWLGIYNDREKNFFIYFDRNAGCDIGWADSVRWEDAAFDAVWERVRAHIESYVKSYLVS